MRIGKRFLAVVPVLFIGLIVAATPPQQPRALSPEESLELDAKRYSEEYDVSLGEAKERLSVQDAIGELDNELQEEEADIYAGLWIQHQPEFRVFVAFTENGQEIIKPYLEGHELQHLVEIQEADISLVDLQASQEALFNDLDSLGIRVAASLDVKSNTVELTVDNSFVLNNVLMAQEYTLPSFVSLKEGEVTTNPQIDIYAGRTMRTYLSGGATARCTSGFIVETGSGTKYATTAGHCYNNPTYYEYSGSSTWVPFVAEWYGGRRDFQLHTITSPLTAQPWAANGASGWRTISGSVNRSSQSPGTYLCHYGDSTGYSCGTINSNYVCYTINGTPGCGWVNVSGASASGGDSGGPWYKAGDAYGWHHGLIGGLSVYMPVDRASDLGYPVWH